jgi:hypothetical protein
MNQKREIVAPVWAEWRGNGALLLRWNYYGHDVAPRFGVFVDGALLAVVTEMQCLMPVSGPGRHRAVRVVRLAVDDAATLAGYVYEPPRGARVRLAWPGADLASNGDFKSTLIYMSADGSEPAALYAELRGAQNRTLVTGVLQDGITYKFRARYQDIHGNLGAWGATVARTVNGAPASVAGQVVSYDQATRTATITAARPASQAADVVGYELVSNDLPGIGLQAALVDGAAAWAPAAGTTLSATTAELGEGAHKWAWRAVDGSGLRSAYVESALVLARSGGALVAVAAVPARPLRIDAVAGAGGVVLVRVRVGVAAAGNVVRIYRGGALDGSAAMAAGVYEYAYTTAALSDGVSYSFCATVASSGGESEATETVSATADATAPTGDATLTASVCD